MDEKEESINQKNSILLSRNRPIAFVVGAAGFLGSHLVDKLLEKNIQVIGADDLADEGSKENLSRASGSSNFHPIFSDTEDLNLDLTRLDYLFIAGKSGNLDKLLDLFKKFKARCLLISSIELYGKEDEGKAWLKKMEEKIAKFAAEYNLNARILRLGPVFGPRMDFSSNDPIIRLLEQALSNNLQKEEALEFSSRALYISDATELILRTIFAGSTAQKIFDGVNPDPVKVSEIKQVLLDPLWYESRDFSFSLLPPWPTPNLIKTIKILNWHPRAKMLSGLRETLAYFKDNEIKVPQKGLAEEKKEELEAFKKDTEEVKVKLKINKKRGLPKITFPLRYLLILMLIALVSYAIIWPALVLGWGVFNLQKGFNEGLKNLTKGDFKTSISNFEQAKTGAFWVRSIFESLKPVIKSNIFQEQEEAVAAALGTATGLEDLLLAYEAVTGERSESPKDYFSAASVELDFAGKKAKTKSTLPLLQKAQILALILPNLVALEGSRDYLILLQDNTELKPAGGLITSFARVSFTDGKLKKLEVKGVDPNWKLADSNWEPDFPTSARQAEWFYNKETGEKVEGVIAFDRSAIETLSQKEKTESSNLTVLANELFNKIFFMPQTNWPRFLTLIQSLLEEKHISIYLNDPKMFTIASAQNWTHALPKVSKEGENDDFLAMVEANMGRNKANYYLDRNYKLETVVGKDGEIKHRMRVGYTNRSPQDTYKDRLRIYLPFGSRLTRVLWGESEKTKEVSAFVDWGRSGYSMFLELLPKEQKTLVLDYTVPVKVEFKDGKAAYRLNIIKQAGTLKDTLEWSISYPPNYRSSREKTITTDLSVDRSFEVKFTK